jgi:hypothetical protein
MWPRQALGRGRKKDDEGRSLKKNDDEGRSLRWNDEGKSLRGKKKMDRKHRERGKSSMNVWGKTPRWRDGGRSPMRTHGDKPPIRKFRPDTPGGLSTRGNTQEQGQAFKRWAGNSSAAASAAAAETEPPQGIASEISITRAAHRRRDASKRGLRSEAALRRRAARANEKRANRRRTYRGQGAPAPVAKALATGWTFEAQEAPRDLDYAREIVAAHFNCQGLVDALKKDTVEADLVRNNIDVAFLLETHINVSTRWDTASVAWFCSSDITYDQRERSEKERAKHISARDKRAAVGKAKAKAKVQPAAGLAAIPADPGQPRDDRQDREFAGVAVVYKKSFEPHVEDVILHGSRIIEIRIRTKPLVSRIIGAYAPTANHSRADKRMFYERLSLVVEAGAPHLPTYVVGDFNCRLGKARIEDSDVVGPFSWCPPEGYDNSEEVEESREEFIRFCLEHDFRPENTWRPDRPTRKLTVRRCDRTWHPPWNKDFGEIDHTLVRPRWKNTVRTIRAKQDTLTKSDHALVIWKFRVKLKAASGHLRKTWPDRRCTKEELEQFNQALSVACRSTPDLTLDAFSSAIQEAAEQHWPRMGAEQKKSYLSNETWNLIQSRQQARFAGDHELEMSLHKKVRKAARRDRLAWLDDQLKEKDNPKESWKYLKIIKKKYVPRTVSLLDDTGRPCNFRKSADVLANHLEREQWAPPAVPPDPLPEDGEEVTQDTEAEAAQPFELRELENAIRQLKNHKAGGPDNTIAEQYKAISGTNLTLLLDAVNKWWRNPVDTSVLENSNIVCIWKKGDPSKPENYRPISLTNILYKIICIMIRTRLNMYVEEKISEEQFGFRQGRSTSGPIHIARRAQEFQERGGSPLIMILLDWKQAFDKIMHDRLLDTLKRLNIPSAIRNAIAALYRDPKYVVVGSAHKSQEHRQRCGVKQGCPLSPTLFILCMTLLVKDTIKAVKDTLGGDPPLVGGLHSPFLLYADDILLLETDPARADIWIKEIETQAAKYGMRLNRQKCEVLSSPLPQVIKFADGTLIRNVSSASYLGKLFTSEQNEAREITQRLGEVWGIIKRLEHVWHRAKIEKHWKLRVMQAILLPKTIYGWEVIRPNPKINEKVDSVQARILRRILHRPPTWIDRRFSHAALIQEANDILAAAELNGVIRPWSTVLEERRVRFLGHVIREGPGGALFDAAFESEHLEPRNPSRWRVGRPRKIWTEETLREAWKLLDPNTSYGMHQTQLDQLILAAQLRMFPFDSPA